MILVTFRKHTDVYKICCCLWKILLSHNVASFMDCRWM